MAFTANAAIMPRNKFTPSAFEGSGASLRRNQLVNETRIAEPRAIILAAEFSSDYRNLGVDQGGGRYLIKSHRPINAFYNFGTSGSGGYDEYSADPTADSAFVYPDPTYFPGTWPRPARELEGKIGVIDGAFGSELNAVGRHHPGGDDLGGTTNFLFTDAHVERKTLASTLIARQWGNYYYSLDDQGSNEVRFYGASRPPAP